MALTNAERQRRHRVKRRAENPPKIKEPKPMTMEQLDRQMEKRRRAISERTLCAIYPLVCYLQNPDISEKKLNNLANNALEDLGEPETETPPETLPDIVIKPLLNLLAWSKQPFPYLTETYLNNFLNEIEGEYI